MLLNVITKLLPEDPSSTPMTTSRTKAREAYSELIREAALSGLRMSCRTRWPSRWTRSASKDHGDRWTSSAIIYVEREGQKTILWLRTAVGWGGSSRMGARRSSSLLGQNVFLDLRIKVLKLAVGPEVAGRLGF